MLIVFYTHNSIDKKKLRFLIFFLNDEVILVCFMLYECNGRSYAPFVFYIL